MVMVTTIGVYELEELMKNNTVCLDNDSLIFGHSDEAIKKYFIDRLGGTGYVMGINGNLNENSIKLLEKLDNLHDEKHLKFIIEAQVNDSDVLTFTVKDMVEASRIMMYGLPDSSLYAHLDKSSANAENEKGVKIICVPEITKKGKIRVTALGSEIEFNDALVSFVPLDQLKDKQ